MSIALRPYQETAVAALRASYASGRRAPLLVAPTGAGKTVMFSHIAYATAARGKRVLIVAHRRELIRQASAKLTASGVEHGIVAPGFTPSRDAVQVGSVQTLDRRLDRIGAFDLIVIDEAHHAVAGQWARLVAAQPGARLLGVTATPERMDGRGLGAEAGGCFDDLVLGPSIAELTEGGFLSPAKVFAPAEAPDLSGVRTRGGDYEARGLEAAMDVPSITGDAVAHYERHAARQPAIAFCVSIQHAEDVARTFRESGWQAVAVSGDTPPAQRDRAIAGLGTGETQILTTCDLISEGLDVPAVGAVLLLRPTQSLGLYVQQVGRGLRPAPGKTHLIVLDHAGNTLRHGLPDTPREWTLDGRPKRAKAEKEKGVAVRQCPACFIMNPAGAAVCLDCNEPLSAAGGRELQKRDGELAEVDAERMARLRAMPLRDLLKSAGTRAELEEIRKARGYAPGWTWHVMRERRQPAAAEGAAA